MFTPLSGVAGIAWPGLLSRREDPVFALLYQLEHSQWWPAEVLLAHQLRQLEPLVAHAAREVPFYRDRLDAVARIAPGKLTLQAWRGLPPLRRPDIQASGEALVAPHLPLAPARPLPGPELGSPTCAVGAAGDVGEPRCFSPPWTGEKASSTSYPPYCNNPHPNRKSGPPTPDTRLRHPAGIRVEYAPNGLDKRERPRCHSSPNLSDATSSG